MAQLRLLTSLPAALLLTTGACAGTDISPPPDTAAYDTDCDTDAPPMTSGGTYGPAWPGAGGDTASDVLDVGSDNPGPGLDLPPPEIIPDEDPSGWEYNQPEDTYYRSVTAQEMVDNPWLSPSDLLVIPPRQVLQALSSGSGSMNLPIPIAEEFGGRPQKDLLFRTLILGKTGTREGVSFIEQRWENDCLRRSTLKVSFSFYESRAFDPTNINLDDIVGAAISTATRDSLAVRGATKELSFALRGPYLPSRVNLEFPIPSSETNFYILKTEFDPAPGQLLSGSGTGSPLQRDTQPAGLTGQPRPTEGQLHLCSDGIENGTETDIDCGGLDCHPCSIGQSCDTGRDCTSGLCYTANATLPGICSSQCTDGLDNDGDAFADACDFNCVEHPDFRTDTIVHQVPLEHATTIGQFGTVHYCTINEQSYIASFLEWSTTGTVLLNNVVPDDDTIPYGDSDRPPPFVVTMRGCVIADSSSIAEDCDMGINDCPELPGYPLASETTDDWGSANSGGLGQATGVLGRVWPLVDYIVEQGTASDTTPIQIAIAYPLERDLNQSENGLAVGYDGPGSPATAGAAVSYWGNTFAGNNFAHEVGHTIGLSHENGPGEGSVYPGTSQTGFMTNPAGPAPVLDADATSGVAPLSQWTTWLNSAAKDIPRASGFSHLGCENNDLICQNGHPGLTCDQSTQTCR